jgi:hypothetical protein
LGSLQAPGSIVDAPRRCWTDTDTDTEKLCKPQGQNWTDGRIAKALDVARITVLGGGGCRWGSIGRSIRGSGAGWKRE